jgi:hypothetical protein
MNILTAAAVEISSLTGSLSDKDPLIQHIHSKVMQTIENSDNVPGLKSEEFNSLKIGIAQRWNELVEKGVLEVTATDKDVRPYFVALQGIVEHVLSHELNKSVKSLTGVIHTPMPATPLCTEGNVSIELVDSSIAEDPLRLFTVKARTTIIRDYLFQGGDLYIVYPKEGITKRNDSQQQIYKKELESYPSHLFDRPLDCASIDNDLIGAFYLFKSAEGKVFAFAIKMTQANSPQDLGSFGLWFGEVNKSPVNDRISNVLHNILKYSSQPIALPL